MYPGFNIYESILRGSWQPLLPSNREPARFDSLLQVVRCVNGCGCRSFFNGLASLSPGTLPEHRKTFLPEVLRLSGICGCGGHNVFLNLPAAGSRERFYNLLTGYCLQNYEEWIGRVLRDNCRKETGKWFHYRLVERLYSLLALHLPDCSVPTELLLIACRVKAATAILMDRLLTAMPVKDDCFHTYLWPRQELKSALAACDLALPARKDVLLLFDRATGCCSHPPAFPGPSGTSQAPAPGSHSSLPDDHPLVKLQDAFREDKITTHQLVKKLLDRNNLQQNQPTADRNRRVDSATACRILGISRKTLQRLRDNGELPFVSFGGKYYYLLEDINALLSGRNNKKKPGNGIGRSFS